VARIETGLGETAGNSVPWTISAAKRLRTGTKFTLIDELFPDPSVIGYWVRRGGTFLALEKAECPIRYSGRDGRTRIAYP